MTSGGSSIKAHVTHRTGTKADLEDAGDFTEGEIAVSTDSPRKLVVGVGSTVVPLEMPAYPQKRIIWSTGTTEDGALEITGSAITVIPLASATGPFDLDKALGDTDILETTTDNHGFTIPSSWPSGAMHARLRVQYIKADPSSNITFQLDAVGHNTGDTDISDAANLTNFGTVRLTTPDTGSMDWFIGNGLEINWIVSPIEFGVTLPGKTFGLRALNTGATFNMEFGSAVLEVFYWPV